MRRSFFENVGFFVVGFSLIYTVVISYANSSKIVANMTRDCESILCSVGYWWLTYFLLGSVWVVMILLLFLVVLRYIEDDIVPAKPVD